MYNTRSSLKRGKKLQFDDVGDVDKLPALVRFDETPLPEVNDDVNDDPPALHKFDEEPVEVEAYRNDVDEGALGKEADMEVDEELTLSDNSGSDDEWVIDESAEVPNLDYIDAVGESSIDDGMNVGEFSVDETGEENDTEHLARSKSKGKGLRVHWISDDELPTLGRKSYQFSTSKQFREETREQRVRQKYGCSIEELFEPILFELGPFGEYEDDGEAENVFSALSPSGSKRTYKIPRKMSQEKKPKLVICEDKLSIASQTMKKSFEKKPELKKCEDTSPRKRNFEKKSGLGHCEDTSPRKRNFEKKSGLGHCEDTSPRKRNFEKKSGLGQCEDTSPRKRNFEKKSGLGQCEDTSSRKMNFENKSGALNFEEIPINNSQRKICFGRKPELISLRHQLLIASPVFPKTMKFQTGLELHKAKDEIASTSFMKANPEKKSEFDHFKSEFVISSPILPKIMNSQTDLELRNYEDDASPFRGFPKQKNFEKRPNLFSKSGNSLSYFSKLAIARREESKSSPPKQDHEERSSVWRSKSSSDEY